MLGQLNIQGRDKVETAINRLQTFEPEEGYYLAFSGGKDSVCVKALADMAGVEYDAHYNITTVDPPELVAFVKSFDDVKMDRAYYKDGTVCTMWNLIPKKLMPPTRVVRYCCQQLKETGGEGRFVITGVRRAESARREKRGGLELADTKSARERETIDPDNPPQGITHICTKKAQKILNPIIDWEDDDVWEFIKKYKIRYCELYDQGHTRLGCIGCPMAASRAQDLERYPKYKRAYIRAFDKMIEQRKAKGKPVDWENGEEVLSWWLSH